MRFRQLAPGPQHYAEQTESIGFGPFICLGAGISQDLTCNINASGDLDPIRTNPLENKESPDECAPSQQPARMLIEIGLTATQAVLPHDNNADYEKLRADMLESYEPENPADQVSSRSS